MTMAPATAAPPTGEAWHNWPAEKVLAHLGSTATGLSAQEAAQRLAANGPNELKEGAGGADPGPPASFLGDGGVE